MCKVTVLMPVYNGMPYFREALDSVCAQTLKDIEIMVCDNGSTDGSLELAREYAAKDPRIVIRAHENMGQGPSLVDGLIHSRGVYVGEVDADDKVKAVMYESLLNDAEAFDADVVKCHYVEFAEGWSSEVEVFPPAFAGVPLDIDMLPKSGKHLLIGRPPCVFCGLYKRDFLIKNGLFFRPEKNYEDTSLMFKIAVSARCFVWSDHFYYWHRGDNPNSGTNTLKDFDAISEQYEEIRRFNDEKHLGLDDYINTLMFYTYRWMLGRIRSAEDGVAFYRIMKRDFNAHPARRDHFNSDADYENYFKTRFLGEKNEKD